MKSWLRANIVNVLSFIKVILVGVLLILVISIQVNTARQAAATNQLITSTKRIADQINRAVKVENHNTNQQLGRVNAHLDCIVQFFSQPDRSQKAIANIDTCQVNATEDAQRVKSDPKQQNTVQQAKTAHTQPMQPTHAASQATVTQQAPTASSKQSSLDRAVQDVVSLPSKIIDAMGGLL